MHSWFDLYSDFTGLTELTYKSLYCSNHEVAYPPVKEPSSYFTPTTEQVQMASYNREADLIFTSYQVTQ